MATIATAAGFLKGLKDQLDKTQTQDNWRWCNKCEGLSFTGNSKPGTCPSGARMIIRGAAITRSRTIESLRCDSEP